MYKSEPVRELASERLSGHQCTGSPAYSLTHVNRGVLVRRPPDGWTGLAEQDGKVTGEIG